VSNSAGIASNPVAPVALTEASGHCIGAIPSRLLVLSCVQ
jgi:hypothetical protein